MGSISLMLNTRVGDVNIQIMHCCECVRAGPVHKV